MRLATKTELEAARRHVDAALAADDDPVRALGYMTAAANLLVAAMREGDLEVTLADRADIALGHRESKPT